MSTRAANRELVTGALAAAQGGDIEAFMAALHPDVEVLEPSYLPYAGTYRGKEGFLQLVEQATKTLDLSSIVLLAACADEERCVLLMSCAEVATSEQRVITEHWEILDGLVRRVRVFWFDLPSVVTAVGGK